MNSRSKNLYRIILGAAVIGGSIYVSVKYLFKSSPIIKVLVLIALILIIYLTIDYLIKKIKNDNYGNGT